ncbi:type IV toxin-antitoxin system AbiEi family antitoxin domain-containing protein [Subtercola sp. YIM 133946]|uniref:type IV toxin-antitoxin system AbiEi family antitoxin domain-containing protein n=1 Tax=Subtercola sp. YIM 133946 TaxID=3118909 RepID=UPI002F91E4EE
MTQAIPPTITQVRELDLSDDRHRLAQAARAGVQHRIRRGAYVSTASWAGLHADARYRLRCLAESEAKRTRPILSHWSAAVVHGIPVIGDWPPHVHRLVERASGGRSRNAVVAHPTSLDSVETVEVDGMLVTSVARTIVDLAGAGSFISAVTSADYALQRRRKNRVRASDLRAAFDAAMPVRATARIERVLEFATELTDSPAESVSRVNMYVSGFVMPSLQSEFFDAQGFIGAVDFDWPQLNHVGEVDGRHKYIKDEYLNGRTPGEVVYEEKLREDRLRALPKKVTRWDWHCALDPQRLRAHLLRAGIPLRRR